MSSSLNCKCLNQKSLSSQDLGADLLNNSLIPISVQPHNLPLTNHSHCCFQRPETDTFGHMRVLRRADLTLHSRHMQGYSQTSNERPSHEDDSTNTVMPLPSPHQIGRAPGLLPLATALLVESIGQCNGTIARTSQLFTPDR